MDPFAQAQEDLNRERAMALFRRILPYAALALVLLIAVVAVREIASAVKDHIDAGRSSTMIAAMAAADSPAALQKVAVTDDGARAALAGLLAFQRMDIATQKTDGLKTLDGVAANKNVPKEWRDYAALTATRARIAFGAKAEDADTLLAALKPGADDIHSPFQASSLVESALIYGAMKNDKASASNALDNINTDNLPPPLTKRINMLRGVYGIDVNAANKNNK